MDIEALKKMSTTDLFMILNNMKLCEEPMKNIEIVINEIKTRKPDKKQRQEEI